MCRTICYQYLGKKFVSVQGDWCNCGRIRTDGYAKYPLADESRCNQQCAWNPNEICGGNGTASVYTANLGNFHAIH